MATDNRNLCLLYRDADSPSRNRTTIKITTANSNLSSTSNQSPCQMQRNLPQSKLQNSKRSKTQSRRSKMRWIGSDKLRRSRRILRSYCLARNKTNRRRTCNSYSRSSTQTCKSMTTSLRSTALRTRLAPAWAACLAPSKSAVKNCSR